MRKILLSSILIMVGIISAVILYFQPIVFQSYVLSGLTESKRITIDYGRDECPGLDHIFIWREIDIPESGYLCTSSRLEEGWTYDSFSLLNNGTKRRLDTQQGITARGASGSKGQFLRTETFLFNPDGESRGK